MARLVLVFTFIFFLSGCSLLDSQRCRELQSQGLVQGTVDSCAQCVNQLGPDNVDAIQGCTVGMDAARLIGGQ